MFLLDYLTSCDIHRGVGIWDSEMESGLLKSARWPARGAEPGVGFWSLRRASDTCYES